MSRSRSNNFFRPQLWDMEARTVPASLFVDPTLAGSTAGSTVTFNPGQSDSKTGLTFGTNAFAKLSEAIKAANATTAADTIFLATGTTSVDQSANGGAFLITNPLSITGSSAGAGSTIATTTDTTDSSGTNGAVFAAQSTILNLSSFTFEGNGAATTPVLTPTGFRYENSTGSVDKVTFQNVIDDTSSRGYGLVIIGPSANVTATNSKFTGNGRGGVRFDSGATGMIESSTFTGRSGSNINYGVDVIEGSRNVLITGNTFTGFSATTPSLTSAGVQVADDGNFDYTLNINNPATNYNQPSSATLIGNSFTGNFTGVVVGNNATQDSSTATINNNNIASNSFGIVSDTKSTVNALFNFYGSPAGPLATNNNTSAGNNPGGVAGSEVGSQVIYKDTTQTNNAILQAATPVRVATSSAAYVAAVSPTVTIVGPTGTTSTKPVSFTVTFSSAVTGFTASDVTLSGTAGTGTVTGVTNPSGDGKTFIVTVNGLTKRGTLNVNIPAGAATDAIGYASQAASGAASFAPIFDRGFAIGSDAGIGETAFTVDNTLATSASFSPFGTSFTGGVRVALADVNGDGTLDIIAGSGPGMPGTVKVIDGTDRTTVLLTFVPFGNTFTKGIYVSGGDLTGDSKAEIAISAERGGGARVRILAGAQASAGTATTIADFFAIEDDKFRGGARTAIGDVNGDGTNDLVVAAGFGGGPRIATYNGKTINITTGGTRLSGDFFAFESTLRNGAFVAVGDVNADGKADIIVGAGNGDPRVRAIDSSKLLTSNGTTVTALADFFAFPQGKAGTGARVAARDIDGDGRADILASTGANNGSEARLYFGSQIIGAAAPPIGKSFDLFGNFNNGAYVG